MAKPFSLGRGLGSLISRPVGGNAGQTASAAWSGVVDHSKEAVMQIAPDQIDSNPYQPRQEFRHDELEDLVMSIRDRGIIQPLLVTKLDNGRYQLIAGERRLRAAKTVGLKTVPVLVREAGEDE
ncbi:MAG: ParB/RepB/Spo0J family partition protein, partial [bacterium]